MAEKGKSKAEIAKEKSLITKQRIKEKKKAATKADKKDLDATPKARSRHPIHKKKEKGQDIEIKKRKEDIKKHGKSSPKDSHPAHDPDKGGGKQPPKKGAQAAEPKIVPKKKPLSPEQKKKDKAIMKAEEARRKKAKAKAKSAPIMKAEKKRRAEAKKDMPTGRSAAASGAAKGKDIAMGRKKYVLGTLKDKPSGKR